MRAMASAIIHLLINLAGGGAGPLIIGALSDRLEPAHGEREDSQSLGRPLVGELSHVGRGRNGIGAEDQLQPGEAGAGQQAPGHGLGPGDVAVEAGLDPRGRDEVAGLVSERRETRIVSSHDMRFVSLTASRVVILAASTRSHSRHCDSSASGSPFCAGSNLMSSLSNGSV